MPRQKNSRAYKTKRLALCAVLAALGVVLLGIGAIVEVMDITTPMLASLLLIPIMLCYGNGYAVMTYAVISVLSIILMPYSFAPWLFVGLAGYYPMVKSKFDRLPRIFALILKAVLVFAALALYFCIFYLIMMQGAGSLSDAVNKAFGDENGTPWMAWAVVALAYVAFFAYDLLIDRVLVIYHFRWRERVEKWMK